jgi:general secretion pathway protein D
MTSRQKIHEAMPVPLKWIETLAFLAGLIGVVGFIALSAPGAWAAKRTPAETPPTERKGFESGNRGFANPFLPAQPTSEKPNTFFDDDTDEDEDWDDTASGSPPGASALTPGRGSSSNQGSIPGSARGSQSTLTTSDQKNVSLGGTNSGVISHGKVDTLKIDTETGEGSKEIVTDFNFPDADIMDIAKALGKLTGKNFILDKDVKGRITIISNSPITVGDAWKAFLTALDINGFALIPSGKMVRIARQRDARDKQLRTYTGDYSPDTDALITRLFPLKYLSADEVARNFRSFMPANSRIIPYDQTNTVIVTDTGSNIAKLEKLLQILDVEGYDAGIEVIPVKYASAVELSKLIDTLVPGTGGAAGSPGAPRFGGGGGRFTARRTKEGGIINTIIADERTNTLIVHANSKGADEVRELVSKLDQKMPASTGGGKVHVVYLQFAEAEQIANTLNNLSQSGGTARPSTPIGGGTGINPVQASLFEGTIRISPDKSTNSLVITASPGDFVTIQRVINRLDIPRDQVYAEVVIMEVSLGRDFNFATNLVAPKAGIGLTPSTDLMEFIQSPFAQKGAILSFASQEKSSFKINGSTVELPNLQSLIKAIQTNSNANILATPQILTLDNTEATFETAERIPFPTTTAVQGTVSASVSKENVSLVITIKPQINKISNFVKLDIQAKLADISGRELPAQVRDLAVATVERNAKTSIVVADKDTVVLGGLMRDNVSEQISKVPILGDIPILGWLFKAKRTQTTKTNLLIFITPNIVRQYEKVRAILDKKLKERDDFLEAETGGDDPIRKYRDNIIRNLPDIKEITAYKPQSIHTLDEDGPAATPVEPQSMNIPPAAPPSTGTTQPSSSLSQPGEPPQTVPLDTQTQPPVLPDSSLASPINEGAGG